VQHWKFVPRCDRHEAPGATTHAEPQAQDELHTLTPHEVVAPVLFMSHPVRVSPGTQPLSPVQPPNALHAPQSQPALTSHVRVRVCVPELQRPQGCVSVSVWPGMHTPLPPPTQVLHPVYAPHWQVAASQVRECVCVPVPQLPHIWSSLSTMPATQTPSPEHAHAPHVQSA
jgi:hypothetical protein